MFREYQFVPLQCGVHVQNKERALYQTFKTIQNGFIDLQTETNNGVHAPGLGRDYLALEGSLWIKKLAFLIYPPVTDMISAIYLDTHSKKVPTRSFTKKAEALAYLGIKGTDDN